MCANPSVERDREGEEEGKGWGDGVMIPKICERNSSRPHINSTKLTNSVYRIFYFTLTSFFACDDSGIVPVKVSSGELHWAIGLPRILGKSCAHCWGYEILRVGKYGHEGGEGR